MTDRHPDESRGRPAGTRAGGDGLRHALDTMPHAFYSIDADFGIVEVNIEGARLLRRAREELTGTSLLSFPVFAGRGFEAQLRRALSAGGPLVFEEYVPPLESRMEVHTWPAPHGLHLYLSVGGRRQVEGGRRTANGGDGDAPTGGSRLLTVVAERLVDAGDRLEVLHRLTEVLVPELADWCTIIVPGDDALVRVAARHVDAARNELAQRLVGSYPHVYSGPSPGVVVYRSGRPLRMSHLVESINKDLDDSIASTAYGRTLRLLGDGPGLITPVIVGGAVEAVITMTRTTGEDFSDPDMELMVDVASHVSVALVAADHVESQHETARALQAAALPGTLPDSEELRLAAGYRPASGGGQIGGDWYDAFELESGKTALVVGDVAGHGIGAAALTAQMRNALRAHLFSGSGPLESLNQLSHLIATQEPEALATIVCAEIDLGSGEVTWASAGHPAPIVVRGPGHSFHLTGRPVRPIGWTGPSPADGDGEHRFVLANGARMFLFTDGLYERRHVDLDIGLAHLMILAEQSFRHPGLGDACTFILDGMPSQAAEDDACLLVAERQ